jgi:hypothetical protein
VSPQYHIIFDEKLSNVSTESIDEFTDDDWLSLFDIGYERYLEAEQFEEDDVVPWDLPPDIDLLPTHRNTINNGQERYDSVTQVDPINNQEVSTQTDPTDPGQQRERAASPLL